MEEILHQLIDGKHPIIYRVLTIQGGAGFRNHLQYVYTLSEEILHQLVTLGKTMKHNKEWNYNGINHLYIYQLVQDVFHPQYMYIYVWVFVYIYIYTHIIYIYIYYIYTHTYFPILVYAFYTLSRNQT